MPIDISITLTITFIFVLAGAVKGATGVGLPTVAIGLLTATIGIEKAVPIILIPSIVTNIWQGATGGYFAYALKRLWLFLVALVLTIFVGVSIAGDIDTNAAASLLAILLVLYAVIGLAGFVFKVPAPVVGPVGVGLGCVNGILTGVTGSFVFPGIPFIKAIGMPRDASLQAMGIFMTLASFFLGLALLLDDRLPLELGMTSALAVIPALVGMVFGRRIAKRFSDKAFNTVFMVSMLLVGLYILAAPMLK